MVDTQYQCLCASASRGGSMQYLPAFVGSLASSSGWSDGEKFKLVEKFFNEAGGVGFVGSVRVDFPDGVGLVGGSVRRSLPSTSTGGVEVDGSGGCDGDLPAGDGGEFGSSVAGESNGERCTDSVRAQRGPSPDAGRLGGAGVVDPASRSSAAEDETGGSGSGLDSSSVETKTERNRRWRKEKKDLKSRRKARQLSAALASTNWNADKLVAKRPGFFSDCPADVQQALRDSRAEFLIARNKLDKASADRKLQDLTSNVQLVSDTIKLMRMQQRLEATRSKGCNARVGGWANTVLSDASEDFVNKAASARSSVPSLDSVPVEVAEVKVDNGVDEVAKKARLLEYEVKRMELIQAHDELDFYAASTPEADLYKLRQEYADVALTEGERVGYDFGDRLLQIMGTGISENLIIAMAEAGLLDPARV